MAEYIERETLINIIKERNGRVPEWIEECISGCPKVGDVRSERHGHWIISSDGYYPYCSECTKEPPGREMTDWCPNCGAKMDGKDGDSNG